MSVSHAALYRFSRGGIGGRVKGPVLLLTTKGRKSGRAWTIPLLYVQTGRGWSVVGSYAGSDQHPAWWLNLQAEANAEIQIGGTKSAVAAREAGEDERAELWPQFVSMYPDYEKYRHRTRRRIPVVILEPK